MFCLIIDEFGLPARHYIWLLVYIIVKIDISSFWFFVLQDIYYQFTVLITRVLWSDTSSSGALRSYGTHIDSWYIDKKKAL
jgi:hypothetical protein